MCFRQFWDVVTGVVMGTDMATDFLQIVEFSHTKGERAALLFHVSLGIYIFNAILWTFIYLAIIYLWKNWQDAENDPLIPRWLHRMASSTASPTLEMAPDESAATPTTPRPIAAIPHRRLHNWVQRPIIGLMNGVQSHLLRCLFVDAASDWFSGRTFIRWTRRRKGLMVASTLTLALPALYLVSLPVYAVYGALVGAAGCFVLFLVLLLLFASCIFHLLLFLCLLLLCSFFALFTLTVGMYVLPVVLTCYDRSRFILHMKIVESVFESFPQIVVMSIYAAEFPAGPGVIVSLACSCLSLAFAFVKGFCIDSCHDAADFRSEVGTFRRRAASRCSSRSAPEEVYQECQEGATATFSPDSAEAPPPYQERPHNAGIVKRLYGEPLAV